MAHVLPLIELIHQFGIRMAKIFGMLQ